MATRKAGGDECNAISAVLNIRIAEADRLQEVADAHKHPVIGALVATALATGLRLGEMQALTWGGEGPRPRPRRRGRAGEP